MAFSQKIWSILVIGAALSGCATGLDKEVPTGADAIDVVDECQSTPVDGQENVPLDQTIELTFNRMIDPGSADERYFHLFTADGATVQTVQDPNGRLQPALNISHALVDDDTGSCQHPNNAQALNGQSTERQKVSRLYITPVRPLMPETEYRLYYGPNANALSNREEENTSQDGNDETAEPGTGIVSLPTQPGETMAYVQGNTKSFKTGSDLFKFQKGQNDISHCNYRIINANEEGASSLSFQSIVANSIAMTKGVSIQCAFTQPNRVHAVDTQRTLTKEMVATKNKDAPGAAVFTIEASDYVSDLARKIPKPASANPTDALTNWHRFMNGTVYKRISGTWKTTHGRKILRFDPDTNCSDPGSCFYPDNKDIKTIAQVVVAVIYGPGFSSTTTKQALKRPHYIVAFAHVSGFMKDLFNASSFSPGQNTSLLGGGR